MNLQDDTIQLLVDLVEKEQRRRISFSQAVRTTPAGFMP